MQIKVEITAALKALSSELKKNPKKTKPNNVGVRQEEKKGNPDFLG